MAHGRVSYALSLTHSSSLLPSSLALSLPFSRTRRDGWPSIEEWFNSLRLRCKAFDFRLCILGTCTGGGRGSLLWQLLDKVEIRRLCDALDGVGDACCEEERVIFNFRGFSLYLPVDHAEALGINTSHSPQRHRGGGASDAASIWQMAPGSAATGSCPSRGLTSPCSLQHFFDRFQFFHPDFESKYLRGEICAYVCFPGAKTL